MTTVVVAMVIEVVAADSGTVYCCGAVDGAVGNNYGGAGRYWW